MTNSQTINLRVNGETIHEVVDHRLNLVDFLREKLELTGSHVGCEHGVCGACTVFVDGKPVRGCLMLAVQADDREVVTVEGLEDTGLPAKLREAFAKRNALQCGFCTPGMLVSSIEYLQKIGDPSKEKIRQHISGNYCRCTGYQSIIDAISDVIRGEI